MSDIADQSAAVLRSPVTRKVREDVKEALYQMWLACETPEEREQVWGIATGAEMFWRTLEGYEVSAKVEDIRQSLKEAIA